MYVRMYVCMYVCMYESLHISQLFMITDFIFVIFSTFLRFVVTFLFLANCSFLCLAEKSFIQISNSRIVDSAMLKALPTSSRGFPLSLFLFFF